MTVQTVWESADVERLGASLNRYCLSLTRSTWEAEDLAQETWAKTMGSPLGSRHVNQEAYMLRIAKNIWIDRTRRSAILSRIMSARGRSEMATMPDDSGSAIEAAFEALLVALPPLQLAVFLLRDVFGFSGAETADRLRTTEGAVKAALHRARGSLPQVRKALERGTAENREEAKALLRALASAYRVGDIDGLVALVHNDALEPSMAIGWLQNNRVKLASNALGRSKHRTSQMSAKSPTAFAA
ncbi:RNA polymerase sigma factor [Cohnella soli]|uniref:RNA polymerase sigma factor n=1 Tax=Cohnella soli TaxID=425005 RepID=A0ABW0HX99_9BACL